MELREVAVAFESDNIEAAFIISCEIRCLFEVVELQVLHSSNDMPIAGQG